MGSFANAWRGLVRTAREERNFRIHLAALCYATAAGLLAGLDGGRWAAVLLCFGGVLAAELFNTAIERLCDGLHPAYHPAIGAAKDAAAGAVLALSLASVGVALAVFGPWVLSGGMVSAIVNKKWLLPTAVVSLPCAILWIRGSKK